MPVKRQTGSPPKADHPPSITDAFDVLTGDGVDADFFAGGDEGGDLDFGSGFDRGSLGHVGRCVTADGWLGVGDFERHMRRRGEVDQAVVPIQQLADAAFFDESQRLGTGFQWQRVLLERFVIHEDVAVGVAIRVHAVGLAHISGFEAIAALVSFIEIRALEQVSESRAIQGLAFTRLDEFEADHVARFAVDEDFDSLLEVAGADVGHWTFSEKRIVSAAGVGWALLPVHWLFMEAGTGKCTHLTTPSKGRVYNGVARLVSSMGSGNVSRAEQPNAERSQAASNDWRRSLGEAIRNPGELLSRLGLAALGTRHSALGLPFPLLVPESFLKRMKPGDVNDPLLRQVLPLAEEGGDVPGFTLDALDEAKFRKAPGLLHKYEGRALLMLTGACAVHCRYCFRRHYPYSQEPKRLDDWEPAFAALEQDESIHEVLLSGGDPLMLTDERLSAVVRRLESIPHLRRLRWHTRLPIVLPDRVTFEWLDLLTSTRLTPIVVVHANHPRELVADCALALRQLTQSGVMTLNQAVLLRGVNDSVETLVGLSERLIDLGIKPYYLHQMDRVAGTAHFEVPEETGLNLMAELRQRLPGYAVPQYVREVPGEAFKVPIAERLRLNAD